MALGPKTHWKRCANLLPVIQRFFGYWIVDTLLCFLHGDKGHAFSVSRKALRLPGNSTAAGRFAAGSGVAVLRSPRLHGRLVRVVRVKREWDQCEIAADLEQSRYFADGCYHVNSLFCLSRRFGSTEAACERWIGGLKYLFHPVQGPTTTTLVQRLRARVAGVRGNGADEAFVQLLAQELHGRRRRMSTNRCASRRGASMRQP